MEKELLLFKKYAQDLLDHDFYNEWIDEIFNNVEVQPETANEELKEWMEEYDCGGQYSKFLESEEAFVLAHSCGDEMFIKYLNHYFDAAEKYYSYWEYEYPGFGSGYPCFSYFDPYILMLCIRYFDSINENEKATTSCFYLLCHLSYNKYSDEDDVCDKMFYDLCENKFESIKPYIGADWLTVHPSITWNIGQYYLLKKDYSKGIEFFSLGSEIDYDGRQSIEPFIAVGKNQYELGMMYYKGLGVEIDPEQALEYFTMAADNAGEPTIPVIQDMREEKLIPIECDPEYDRLNGYGAFNVYNLDMHVYYKELNDEQYCKLKNEAEFFLTQEGLLDFDMLNFLRNIYRYRIKDKEKLNLIENKMYDLVKSISLQNRDDKMDKFYVSYWKKEWEKVDENPMQVSGTIPKNPKPGDIFTYGTFNNEPIEWKVLEIYDDGTFYVTTNKILFKMSYDGSIEWLNTKFYEKVFTEEEKKHIVAHKDYTCFRKYAPTYLYYPCLEQLNSILGNVYDEEIEETNLAKEMSKNVGYYDAEGRYISPDSENVRYRATFEIRGIRPSMDLYLENKENISTSSVADDEN